MNGIWSEFAEEGLKEMLYADKIMNTEKYKELKVFPVILRKQMLFL